MGLKSLAENSSFSSLNLAGSLNGRFAELAISFLLISLFSIFAEMKVTSTGLVSKSREPFVSMVTTPLACGNRIIPCFVQ